MTLVGIIIALVVAGPVAAFAAWFILADARVRIDAGSIGLLVLRGKGDRSLEPGVHYVWPYRKQLIVIYPLRELAYLASNEDQPETDDFVDPPLRVDLGDRTAGTISYTLRARIRPDGLPRIHERVGPDGLKALLRDRSRAVIIDHLSREAVTYESLYGEPRRELEASLRDTITAGLAEDGFEVVLFSLRDVDLGEVGEVLQATVRARADVAREDAAAAVRRLRVENEAALNEELGPGLADAVLRYRQIELWREFVERWDGRSALPGIAAPIAAIQDVSAPPPAPPAEQQPGGAR